MTDSPFYRRLFAIVTAAALGYLLLQVLAPLDEALGWAMVLAFMLHPLHKRLARALKGRQALSAGVFTVATPLVVLAPLSFLAVLFAGQAVGLLHDVQRRPFIGFPALIVRLKHLPLVGTAMQWIARNLPAQAVDVHAWFTGVTTALLTSAATAGGNVAFGLFGTVIGFFMTLFLLFFLLRDGEMFLQQAAGLIPLAPDRRERLLRYLGDVTLAVVYGSTITAVIQGLFVAAGFALAGVPAPLVFGVLAMIAALLPAGATVVLVPAVAYLLIQARWGSATFLASWGAGLLLVENVVRPLLTAHRAEVSTLAVFVGAIGGVSAFGILGLVFGAGRVSFVLATVRFLNEQHA
jgi:predicted PurR-regulated permease PerM